MTRREPIAFLLAHYSDVLDGVKDRVMGGRAGRRHRAHNRLDKETSLGFGQAIVLGLLCNALVCLAVSLTYGARTTADKILAIIPPIAAFVALGFEHSVANMYFIPVALLIKSDGSWMDTTTGVPDVNGLTWGSFLYDNLLPVTIGNVVGGGNVFVGGARVVKADVVASNGVIHAINQVLIPR